MSAQRVNTPQKEYVRFQLGQRIEHILLIVSFTTLTITGLVQKFPGSFSEAIIAGLGGIEALRIIHRIAAVMFILETIYHVIVLAYKVYVQKVGLTMLPGLKDAKDAIQSFAYNFGLSKTRPKMGRYTFDEKAEYWALVWGSVVMVVTGFMLWNPIATTGLLPGEFIPAARAAHGGEALLAALAIVVWHIYHVHIKTFNKSMFTGKLSREEMAHEHPLELEELERQGPKEDPAHVQARRRKVFIPVAAIATLAFLAATIYFVTLEDTALATVPPVSDAPVFDPRTATPMPTLPPTATARPTEPGEEAALTWNGGVGEVFDSRCSLCHGNSGGFSVDSYADVMAGGDKGAVIVEGNADTSSLVVLMASGAHPGKFSAEELETIKAWINAGAPEE